MNGFPEEAIYTDKEGRVRLKGFNKSIDGKTTVEGKGGRLFDGIKRAIGGAADIATGHMFDFDKRSGGGFLRKTAMAGARVAGGVADMMTGNLFDFDKRSDGGLLKKMSKSRKSF